MTMMLPEENIELPRDVFAAASHTMVSGITLEDDLFSDDDDDDIFYGELDVEDHHRKEKRITLVRNRSQEILNILESIDSAYEEVKPERKKLGKLYSTMPVLQPVRKKSKEGLFGNFKEGHGAMQNATFTLRPSPTRRTKPLVLDASPRSPQRHGSSNKRPSPFDAIVQSSENLIRRDFHRGSSGFQKIQQPPTFQRAQTLGSTAPLTNKWDSSPRISSSRKKTLGSSKADHCCSMPVFKPVRRLSNERPGGEMRNATFSSMGPSLGSKKVASPFDAILRGGNNKPHQIQRGSSLMTPGSKKLQPMKLQRAQTEGSTSVIGSTTPLPDKWLSSPSCRKSTLNRASKMNHSMPVLKPVRKRSKEDCLVGETPSERVGNMRNATFSSPRGGLGPSSKKVASRFDAILNNKKTSAPSPGFSRRSLNKKTPSPFDAIVKSTEKRLQQLEWEFPMSPLAVAQTRTIQPLAPPTMESSDGLTPILSNNSRKRQTPKMSNSSTRKAIVPEAPHEEQKAELNLTPKASNSSRKTAQHSKKPQPQQQQMKSTSMRRAQSVPHHMLSSNAKWEASSPSPNSSRRKRNNKNALLQTLLQKPERRGSMEMMPMEDKKSLMLRQQAKNNNKKQQQQQQQQQQQHSCYSPAAAGFRTTLLEATAIEMMLSNKSSGVVRTPTKDATNRMLLQRNQ